MIERILRRFLDKSPDVMTVKELIERCQPENLKSGDIIKTIEYVGEVDSVSPSSQPDCVNVHFRWAKCITSGSKDSFIDDTVNVLKKNIEVLRFSDDSNSCSHSGEE